MTMNGSFRLAIAAVAALFAMHAYADAPLSNKWRIQCSESAKSDGVIQFRVKPEDAEPIEVSVSIEDGRSENGVARDIRDAFQEQLPAGRYSVETDDGEDVLVKKDFGEPNFSLELVASDVKAVRINLDRE